MNDPALPVTTTSALPEWISYFQAFAPFVLALLVAWVAYSQWRTAHHKVVLDLFERRLAVYEAISSVIAKVAAHGSVRLRNSNGDIAQPDIYFQYAQATRNVPFLFGSDVEKYLEALRLKLIQIGLAEDMIEAGSEDNSKWIDHKYANYRAVMEFYEKFPALCEPYMRMDEKRVRSLHQIASDLFKKRRPPPSIEKPNVSR